MKKIAVVMLNLLLVLALTGCNRVSLNTAVAGTVIYNYEGVSFTEALTAEELESVIEVLDGKERQSTLIYGVPSCGFSEDIAIIINGTEYLLARDTCGTIAINGSLDYIDLSPQEQNVLEEIFTSRGGVFPCI